MRSTKLLFIAGLLLSFSQCRDKIEKIAGNKMGNHILIEIHHYSNTDGFSVYYTVTEKNIQVDINCVFKNCKRKTVYERALTPVQADSLLYIIRCLRLDTLQAVYAPQKKSMAGLATDIKISGTGLPGKAVHIKSVRLPFTDSLYKAIDRLIMTKKYRYYGFE